MFKFKMYAVIAILGMVALVAGACAPTTPTAPDKRYAKTSSELVCFVTSNLVRLPIKDVTDFVDEQGMC